MLRTDRCMVAANREMTRDEIVMRLRAYGAAKVYAGLLAYIVNKGWVVGAAAHAFREIYGEWPNRYRNVEPAILPDCLIEQWYACRPKRVIKKPKPAPLVEQVERAEAAEKARVVDEAGFVPGTLMKPDDFVEEWR